MNELEFEARGKANEIRNILGFGHGPIGDIFTLIESEGILLLKKPVERNALSALFLKYKTSFLIFINTSKSLGHQYFSAAHELYHYFYDGELNGSVCNAFQFNNQNRINEKLADYFAVHFLMPETGLIKFVHDHLRHTEIDVKDIVKAQHYFKVSYRTMLVRFKVLGLINESQYESFKSANLPAVFKMLGYPLDLITETHDLHIPKRYIEYLTENYTNNNIDYEAFLKYLYDVGMTPEDLEISEEEGDKLVEETSFDY